MDHDHAHMDHMNQMDHSLHSAHADHGHGVLLIETTTFQMEILTIFL